MKYKACGVIPHKDTMVRESTVSSCKELKMEAGKTTRKSFKDSQHQFLEGLVSEVAKAMKME